MIELVAIVAFVRGSVACAEVVRGCAAFVSGCVVFVEFVREMFVKWQLVDLVEFVDFVEFVKIVELDVIADCFVIEFVGLVVGILLDFENLVNSESNAVVGISSGFEDCVSSGKILTLEKRRGRGE